MNIFRHEAKMLRKSLFFWLIGLLFLIAAGMGKYQGLKEGGEEVTMMLNSFPRAVQAMFGMVGLNVLKVNGYYAVLMFYFLICTAVYGGLMGADVIAGEIIDQTAEYLFSKPVTRVRVVLNKLACRILFLAIFCAVDQICSMIVIRRMKFPGIDPEIWAFTGAGFLIGLLFMAIGVCAAGISKDVRRGAGITMGVFIGTYVLTVVYDMIDREDVLKVIRFFIPLRFFLPGELADGVLSIPFSVYVIVVSLILTVVGIQAFSKRDI